MSKSESNPLLVIDKTIEAIIAEVRLETYPPPIFKASEKTNPFISKENKPRDKILKGKEITFKKGFKVLFKKPSTAAVTINVVVSVK